MTRQSLLILLITGCGFYFMPAKCAATPLPPSPSYCDSLSATESNYVSEYQNNYDLNKFYYIFGSEFGWGSMDSLGNYVTYNLAYWQNQFSACGIPCPPVANYSFLQNLMSTFVSRNPQYADSCPAFLWADYLNQNYGGGYQTGDWVSMLTCGGVPFPRLDTLHTYCDSLGAVLSVYNNCFGTQPDLNRFENMMGQVFGWGHTDSIGAYVTNDLVYYRIQLNGCGLGCPVLANCDTVQVALNRFFTYNPQFALKCPVFIWADYLNQVSNVGYATNDWVQILGCCGIGYPPVDTLGAYCDTLGALVAVYNSARQNNYNFWNLQNLLAQVYGWGGYVYGVYTPFTFSYWQTQFAACGIACPPVVNCSNVQNALNTFLAANTQYVDSCPAFLWTNYLNNSNVAEGSYNTSDWMSILTCCGISYPRPDTLNNFCDSLSAAVAGFNTLSPQNQNLWSFQSYMQNSLYQGYFDSTGAWIMADYNYWFNQIRLCGAPCPQIVNCFTVDSILNSLNSQAYQFGGRIPDFIWAQLLNNAGLGNGYSATQWRSVMQCCGLPAAFATPDSVNTLCDSVNDVVIFFNINAQQSPWNASLWNFEGMLSNYFGCCYQDNNGQWQSRSDSYWFNLLSSCHVSCPNIINCQFEDSLLNSFIAQNTEFNGAVPDFIWSMYLNNTHNNNSGNNYWYSTAQWRLLLQCCGYNLPAPDSGLTYCDSLADVLNYFNFQAQHDPNQYNNAYGFANVFGQCLSQGYNLPDGQWVSYGYSHWASALDSCHLTVPRFVTCSVLDSLMADFLATAPAQYRHACPALIWATYFNQAYFGSGDGGYAPQDWIGLATGCNISFPLDSGLPTKCDSIAAIVSITNLSVEMPIMAVVNSLVAVRSILNSNNNNNNDQQIPLSFWMDVLDSCGYSCDHFLNCNGLDSALQQLYVNFPQYHDSIPAPLLTEYLDQKLGTSIFNGYAFSYDDWQVVASCCHISLPSSDTTFHYCDSMFFLYNLIQQAERISDQCFPAWFYNNTVLPQLGFNSISQLCPALSLCGFSCADTCVSVDLTFCDSIRSVYKVYERVLPQFSALTVNDNLMEGASKAYLGYQLSYSQVMAYLDSCGPASQCPFTASFNISDTVICNSDSTCFNVTGGTRCIAYADSAGGRLMFAGGTPFNLCGLVNPAISSGYHKIIAIIYSSDSACTDTISRLIYIKPYCACGVTVDTCPELQANFGYTIYPGYVILKDKSVGNPTIVEWYVNGQNFVTGPGDTLKYVFTHSGQFEVCQTIHYLIYGSDQCCLKDTCMYIMGSVDTCLILNLTADFSYTPNSSAPYTYNFQPIWPVNAVPSVITWNFGDSSSVYSDTAVQATHTFDTSGYYDVCVNEIWFLPGNYCCIDSQCYQVYVGAIRSLVKANPNPFQHTVTVEFQINSPGKVELLVFDPLGRVVKTLINSTSYSSGYYKADFDLSDLTGTLYNYRFRSADGMFTGKLIKQ